MAENYLEYLTANELIAFPFREDALGLTVQAESPTHGVGAKIPRDFLVDTLILAPQDYYSEVFLDHLTRDGTDVRFFLLNEADGSVAVFDLADGDIPAPRSIVSFSDPATGVSVRFLTGDSFESYLLGIADATTDEFEQTLAFETAAVELRPERVEIIRIPDGIGGEIDLTEDVAWYPGCNIEFDVNAPNLLLPGEVTGLGIAAIPGLGLGQFNACDDEEIPIDFLARLSGAIPDENGNVNLAGGNCHRIVEDPDNNTLQIVNDCIPCCDCQDYANTTEALRSALARLAAVDTTIDTTVTDHNIDVLDYNDNIFPTIKAVLVTTNGQSGFAGGAAGASSNLANIEVSITNRTAATITNPTVVIEFQNTDINSRLLDFIYFGDDTRKDVATEAIVLGKLELTFDPGVVDGLNRVMAAGTQARLIVIVKSTFPDVASGDATVTVDWDEATSPVVKTATWT